MRAGGVSPAPVTLKGPLMMTLAIDGCGAAWPDRLKGARISSPSAASA
jgi:hypothetical protein